MRDSYTNIDHCPSHEMWSYERDGSSGVLLYWVGTVSFIYATILVQRPEYSTFYFV